MKSDIIGIIAGNGDLPNLIISDLKKHNIKFCVISICSLFDFSYLDQIPCKAFSIGQVSGMLKFFKHNHVNKIVLAGGVKKPKFSELKVDLKGSVLLSKIGKSKILGDDNILRTVINYLEEQNFEIVSVLDISQDLIMHDVGLYSKTKPYDGFDNDLKIILNIHKKLSEFDVGQSLIIQDKRILGIEGAEGTDNLIKRCKDYIDTKNKNNAILAKFPKATQDLRVDLPTVGLKTIENLLAANIKILLVDSKHTVFVNKNEVLEYANKHKVVIYGI
jgi:DUF1009 family protein